MKKIFSMLMCMVLLFTGIMLGSCGKKDNVLVVATNAEFPPWEDLDSNQNVIGADADIIKLIAEELNKTVEFRNMDFEGVIGSVQSGACDVAISGLTINDKRKESVDFSIPYYETSQILITKSDDTIFTGTTKEELDSQLEGKKIGVCTGFTGEYYAKGDEDWGFAGIKDATVTAYDNISLAIVELKNGSIDVIIMDDTVAKNVVKSSDDAKIIDVALNTESYGIAIPKGDTELKEKMDAAIEKIRDNGKLHEIFDTWKIDYIK